MNSTCFSFMFELKLPIILLDEKKIEGENKAFLIAIYQQSREKLGWKITVLVEKFLEIFGNIRGESSKPNLNASNTSPRRFFLLFSLKCVNA